MTAAVSSLSFLSPRAGRALPATCMLVLQGCACKPQGQSQHALSPNTMVTLGGGGGTAGGAEKPRKPRRRHCNAMKRSIGSCCLSPRTSAVLLAAGKVLSPALPSTWLRSRHTRQSKLGNTGQSKLGNTGSWAAASALILSRPIHQVSECC